MKKKSLDVLTLKRFEKKLEGCLILKSCKGYHRGNGSVACVYSCDAIGLDVDDLMMAKRLLTGSCRAFGNVGSGLTA